MRIAIALLVVTLAVLGWLLNAEMGKSRDQQDQIRKLTADLADKSKRENIEFQEKCAVQAEKMYRSFGYDPKSDGETYESHYNSELNKCFLAVLTSHFDKNGQFRSRWLLDAYGLREYGEYSEMVTIKDMDKRIFACSLTPDSKNKSSCASEEEYAAFVARYME